MIKTASDCGLFHVKYAKRPAPKARGVPFSVFVLFGKAVAAGLVVRAAAGYLDGVELAVAALEVVAAFHYVAFDGIVAVHILILLFYGAFRPVYICNYACIFNFYTVFVDKSAQVR